MDNDTDDDNTGITMADPAKGDKTLADLPDDFKEDVAAIIDVYGHLDYNALLRRVYEKYPAYAKKRHLRGRARRRT